MQKCEDNFHGVMMNKTFIWFPDNRTKESMAKYLPIQQEIGKCDEGNFLYQFSSVHGD